MPENGFSHRLWEPGDVLVLPELNPPLVVDPAGVGRLLVGRKSGDRLHRVRPSRDQERPVVIRRDPFQRIGPESVMTQQLLGTFDQSGIAGTGSRIELVELNLS